MHVNEALLRQVFETFRRGDREAVSRMFSEDAIFSYPGPGTLHGEYLGRTEIIRFWAAQDRHSGGAFQPRMLDLVAGEQNVFLMVRIGPEDGAGAWNRVVVYGIADGLIATARVFEDDPAAAEAFFSREVPDA